MRARSPLSWLRVLLGLVALVLVAAALPAPLPDDGSVPSADAALPEAGDAADDVAALAAAPALPDPADVPPAPDVRSRADWDPAGTCPMQRQDRTVPERIHLHHTHLPVVEAPGEVPEALRLICDAHRDRGFSDFGYHFAIDPWGVVWQGRGDLPEDARPRVRGGAHAQGFNDGSLGVVLIGDFDVAPPSDAALESLEQLLAHLAGTHGMDPTASVGAESAGGASTRFEEGEHVELPSILGHRDTGANTACPGEHLYRLLPELRRGVAERLAAASA